MPKKGIISALIILLPIGVLAQPANDDCTTAAMLCADNPSLAGNNTGATDGPNLCGNNANAVWYSFNTNSFGGDVNVNVFNVDCPDIGGVGNELQAVILAGDGTCNPNMFTLESLCEVDSMDFTVTATGLAANTEYWVMVTGEDQALNDSIPAQCGFNINIDGPGAQVVGVDFYADDDLEISPGQSIQLGVTGGNNYNWSPTTGLSGNGIPDPIAEPDETTSYFVTTSINGCNYTDTIVVSVEQQISWPNTFTPNEDNINDTWIIERIDDFPRAEIVIYDRWGQSVFKSIGYATPWDGTNNGRKLPTATYYFYIKLNQLEGTSDPITGSVSIVR